MYNSDLLVLIVTVDNPHGNRFTQELSIELKNAFPDSEIFLSEWSLRTDTKRRESVRSCIREWLETTSESSKYIVNLVCGDAISELVRSQSTTFNENEFWTFVEFLNTIDDEFKTQCPDLQVLQCGTSQQTLRCFADRGAIANIPSESFYARADTQAYKDKTEMLMSLQLTVKPRMFVPRLVETDMDWQKEVCLSSPNSDALIAGKESLIEQHCCRLLVCPLGLQATTGILSTRYLEPGSAFKEASFEQMELAQNFCQIRVKPPYNHGYVKMLKAEKEERLRKQAERQPWPPLWIYEETQKAAIREATLQQKAILQQEEDARKEAGVWSLPKQKSPLRALIPQSVKEKYVDHRKIVEKYNRFVAKNDLEKRMPLLKDPRLNMDHLDKTFVEEDAQKHEIASVSKWGESMALEETTRTEETKINHNNVGGAKLTLLMVTDCYRGTFELTTAEELCHACFGPPPASAEVLRLKTFIEEKEQLLTQMLGDQSENHFGKAELDWFLEQTPGVEDFLTKFKKPKNDANAGTDKKPTGATPGSSTEADLLPMVREILERSRDTQPVLSKIVPCDGWLDTIYFKRLSREGEVRLVMAGPKCIDILFRSTPKGLPCPPHRCFDPVLSEWLSIMEAIEDSTTAKKNRIANNRHGKEHVPLKETPLRRIGSRYGSKTVNREIGRIEDAKKTILGKDWKLNADWRLHEECRKLRDDFISSLDGLKEVFLEKVEKKVRSRADNPAERRDQLELPDDPVSALGKLKSMALGDEQADRKFVSFKIDSKKEVQKHVRAEAQIALGEPQTSIEQGTGKSYSATMDANVQIEDDCQNGNDANAEVPDETKPKISLAEQMKMWNRGARRSMYNVPEADNFPGSPKYDPHSVLNSEAETEEAKVRQIEENKFKALLKPKPEASRPSSAEAAEKLAAKMWELDAPKRKAEEERQRLRAVIYEKERKEREDRRLALEELDANGIPLSTLYSHHVLGHNPKKDPTYWEDLERLQEVVNESSIRGLHDCSTTYPSELDAAEASELGGEGSKTSIADLYGEISSSNDPSTNINGEPWHLSNRDKSNPSTAAEGSSSRLETLGALYVGEKVNMIGSYIRPTWDVDKVDFRSNTMKFVDRLRKERKPEAINCKKMHKDKPKLQTHFPSSLAVPDTQSEVGEEFPLLPLSVPKIVDTKSSKVLIKRPLPPEEIQPFPPSRAIALRKMTTTAEDVAEDEEDLNQNRKPQGATAVQKEVLYPKWGIPNPHKRIITYPNPTNPVVAYDVFPMLWTVDFVREYPNPHVNLEDTPPKWALTSWNSLVMQAEWRRDPLLVRSTIIDTIANAVRDADDENRNKCISR